MVINFWATWCKPCLKEMPHMNRLAGEYAGRVTFLAVNADNSKAVAKVAPLIQAKGYDNLIVPLDTGAEVQQLLQVGGILPFTVIFDGQGREIYRHIGYKEGDEEELQARDRGPAGPDRRRWTGRHRQTRMERGRHRHRPFRVLLLH